LNIRIFDRNAELHAIQVTATLYIKTKPVCGPLLTISKSIQLMLKTIRFAALGRKQANNRGKRNSQQPVRHVCPSQKDRCFVLYHISSSVSGQSLHCLSDV